MIQNLIYCIVCKEILKNKRSDAIYCSVACSNRIRNKKYAANNENRLKLIEKRREYNKNGQLRMFTRVKSRAKKNNILFNLEIDDIVIPEFCSILGIKLHTEGGRERKNYDDSYSLDRIIPKLGYVKGNIRVISSRANLLKSNAEIWELEAVINDLKSRQ